VRLVGGARGLLQALVGAAVRRSTASSGLRGAHAERAAVPVGGALVQHAGGREAVDHQVDEGRPMVPTPSTPNQRSTVRSTDTVVWRARCVSKIGVGDFASQRARVRDLLIGDEEA
jgi:hypothetical protein